MTSPMFPGLAGIDAGREITQREDTLVEQLAKIGNEAVQQYRSGIGLDDLDTHRKTYNALTRHLASDVPTFTEQDLQSLVHAYANQKKDTERAAIVRGLYTGVLASELTKRNAQEGKGTKISLNGGGSDFPYLLYFAHTLDEVMIEGFNGDRILSCAGSYGGNVKNATLVHIKGNGAGKWIAADGGRAGPVTLASITGDWVGAWIAWNGKVDTVTLVGIKGDLAGAWIAENGRAGPITLAGITGDRAGVGIAEKNGRADIVTLAGIKGDYAGAWIAENNGRVKRLFAGDNEGENHFEDYTGKIIRLQKHKNAKKVEGLLQQLKEEQEPERLAAISQQLAEALNEVRG